MTESDETWLADEHTAAFGLAEGELRVDVLRSQRTDQGLGCLVAGRGGQEHSVSRAGRKRGDDGLVHGLEPGSRGQLVRQLGGATALGWCEALGGFDQGQRVAVSRCNESRHDGTIGARRDNERGVGCRQAT